MPGDTRSYEARKYDEMLEAQQNAPRGPAGGHQGTPALATATVIVSPLPAASHIMIQAVGGPVRYTLDASQPSATNGFRMLPEHPPLTLLISSNTTLTVIQESGVSPGRVEYMWMQRVAE